MSFISAEFLAVQDFLSKLIPEIVLFSSAVPFPKDPGSISRLLSQQCELYSRKILDLYETLDQYSLGKSAVFESADLSPIKTAQYEKTIENLNRERESLLFELEKYRENREIESLREYELDNREELVRSLEACFTRKDGIMKGAFIMQTANYEIIKEIEPYKFIQWLIAVHREKDKEIENIYSRVIEKIEEENEKPRDFFSFSREIENSIKGINGKIEYLNSEIAKMQEKNDEVQEIEADLLKEREAKKGLEADLGELLEEFKLMKDKFEEIAHENEKLKEKHEIADKTEGVIQEKEGIINNLKAELESFQAKKQEKPSDFNPNKLILDLKARIQPFFTPISEDFSISLPTRSRINSVFTELRTFFALFQDIKGNSENSLVTYWQNLAKALSEEKRELIRELEDMADLKVRVVELENSFLEKQGATQEINESYWRSLVDSLTSEKETLLRRIEESGDSRTMGKVRELEGRLEEKKGKIMELEGRIEEKNRQIAGFNEIVRNWQSKYEKIQTEILEGNFCQDSESEIMALREQILQNERVISAREAEILDYCQTLSQRNEKQKSLEVENRRLVNESQEFRLKCVKLEKELEEKRSVLRNLTEETEKLRKNSELAVFQERKLVELGEKFEDFKTKSFEKIENLASELARSQAFSEQKNNENQELSEILKQLETLSESQARTINLKETHIESLENKIRLIENERSANERQLVEINELKTRNKRCIETISKSSSEINALKNEIDSYCQSQKILENKLFEKEAHIIELSHENKALKGQIEHLSIEKREKMGYSEEIERLREERDKISLEYQRLIEKTLFKEDFNGLTMDMLGDEGEGEKDGFLDLTNMQNRKEGNRRKTFEEKDSEIKRLTKIVRTLSNKCMNEASFPGKKSMKK